MENKMVRYRVTESVLVRYEKKMVRKRKGNDKVQIM